MRWPQLQMSTVKTESIALNALEAIIDDEPSMEFQFNSNDREMSWDGFISLHRIGSKTNSKQDFEGRVPVQIKGHTDAKGNQIDKNKIKYKVAIDDLRAYATEKGVLYFHIFVYGKRKEIFYASLFPSKVADYLEKANVRGNKKSLNIPFLRLDKDPKRLYYIVKQFDEEAKKQGSAYTPLVQDRIRTDELDKLKSINALVLGAEDSYSALLRLASGDVCLYGRTEEDKYDRPIEWVDESIFFLGRDVQQEIAIGKEGFYSQYRCVVDSDGGMKIKPSANLTICITEGKIDFKPITALKEVYTDARFLLRLRDNKAYRIANHEIRINSIGMEKAFEDKLTYIVNLYETLEMIHFAIPTPVNDFSENELRQFREIVNLRCGRYNEKLPDGFCKYIWHFDTKAVPLIVNKTDGQVKLSNAVYGAEYDIFLPNNDKPEEKGFLMPLFVYQDIDVLANLYCYDYSALKKQIDKSEINQKTAAALIDCVLIMVHVYDQNSDEHFLDLAEHLLDLLEAVADNSLLLLNRLQIKKRRGGLNAEEIEYLRSMIFKDSVFEFGQKVLLGETELATKIFEQMPEEIRNRTIGSPIYKLYCDSK